MLTSLLLALSLIGSTTAQLAGTQQTETHPKLSIQKCTGNASSKRCTTVNASVVLDSNWRWAHNKGGYTNCYTGNAWNKEFCPDNKQCAQNCEIEGVDYSGTYGVSTSGNQLSLRFVTKHQYGTNVGSRVYLMENDSKYMMLKLINQEFTFDVDVSQLPCGLNGALYTVSMAQDGGMSKYSTNKAGAKYGTGYCDAQCPHDMKWINGEASTSCSNDTGARTLSPSGANPSQGNVEGWISSDSDPNAGTGKFGTCCDEMDIWESNSMGTAYTPHPCTSTGQTRCSSASECGDNGSTRYQGLCDKDGCDFNSYRMGDTTFFGKGKTVDSTKKMTVVTQFLAPSGTLNEIRRIYIQNGRQIANSKTKVSGMDALDSITPQFCDQSKTAFGDEKDFQKKGGFQKMGKALQDGMVLAMSIWDDHYANMLWLDSAYPLDQPEDKPGIKRGECPRDSGKPEVVERDSADATVIFSNIRIGDIGSTF